MLSFAIRVWLLAPQVAAIPDGIFRASVLVFVVNNISAVFDRTLEVPLCRAIGT